MATTVNVNGETFTINVHGLKHGDMVKGVHAQCDGCGSALDAEAPAVLHADRAIKCPECGSVYPVKVS